MTDEQIDAMEAGLEMDCAVDEAVYGPDAVGVPYRKPSTDWADAMFAAEHFGLFDTILDGHGYGLLLRRSPDGWQVLHPRFFDGRGDVLTMADTGPLAICRAILKLANQISS